MSPSHERTIKILQTLDEELFRFSLGDQTGHKRIVGTLRWINQNLKKSTVLELIASIHLTFGNVIKELLNDEHFDPKTNA